MCVCVGGGGGSTNLFVGGGALISPKFHIANHKQTLLCDDNNRRLYGFLIRHLVGANMAGFIHYLLRFDPYSNH